MLGIIVDVDHAGAEFYGIVMPLMSCSLRDVLDNRYQPSVSQILSWLISAATALADVFEKAGVIHGDIKVGGPDTLSTAPLTSPQHFANRTLGCKYSPRQPSRVRIYMRLGHVLRSRAGDC